MNEPARRRREEREMEREMEMEEVSGGAFICLFVLFLWEGVGLGWLGKEEASIVCVAKASTNALRTGAESQRSWLRTRARPPCKREHARRILRRRGEGDGSSRRSIRANGLRETCAPRRIWVR